jgi:hypothetical protein
MKIFKLKLEIIRGSLAVVLPKEFLLKHKLTPGEALSAVETSSGFLLPVRRGDRGTGAARAGINVQAAKDI